MTFKPKFWFPASIALSAVNLAAVAQAAYTAEPWHATTHAGLALAFGLWARHLGQQRKAPAQVGPQAEFEALEADVSQLRQELSEVQERLDFTERVLAQGAEIRRVGPQQ